MKNKALKTGILALFLLIAIPLLLLYFDMKVSSVILIVVFGLIAGIFIVLFNAYLLPGIWMHKNRFLLYGFLYGIAIFIFTSINHLSEGESVYRTGFLLSLLTAICLGILLGAVFLKLNHRIIIKQSILKLLPDEIVIIEDAARIDNDEALGSGRLILTNKRLVFIYLNLKIDNFEIYFSELFTTVELTEKFGIPNGIHLSEKDCNILVKFPRLWKKEIEKMMHPKNK